MFGDSVLDIIVEKIKRSVWFTYIMDETQDISSLEQVCICMRYVDDSDLSVREDFLGFHDIIGTTAVELYEIPTKTINPLGLDMENCRICEDSAKIKAYFDQIRVSNSQDGKIRSLNIVLFAQKDGF